MKKTILAVIAALLCISLFCACKLFNDPKKTSSSNPLIGGWVYDSVAFGKDSSKLPIEYGLYALAYMDSAKTHFRFTSDSVFTIDKKDTSDRTAYIYEAGKQHVRFNDDKETVYTFSVIDDSTISLSKKDKVTLYLKKE